MPRQTDRTGGECVQSPKGAKAEQTVRQRDKTGGLYGAAIICENYGEIASKWFLGVGV